MNKDKPTEENEQASLLSFNQNCTQPIKECHFSSNFQGYTRGYLYFKGEPLIVIGPHWPFFVCLFSINLGLVFLFFGFLWNKNSPIVFGLGLVVACFQLTSYAYTALINPGIPKNYYEGGLMSNENKNYIQCKICQKWTNMEFKPYHCYDCGVCIEGYDHHCPWTSKCIGRGNIISFYLFLSMTMVLLGYFIFAFSILNP